MIGLARLVLTSLAWIVLAAAVVWWWWTFFYVVGYGYLSWSEAGRCLVVDNDICALAKVLCLSAHPNVLAPYGTGAFWVGLALLSLSLWVGGARNASSAESG